MTEGNRKHRTASGGFGTTAAADLDSDVIVVGAGPAGLVAAALLARAGVRATTLTKFAGTADSPRAHITNQRAMEVFRDLGVEDQVVRAAMPWELMGRQVFAASFAGRELSRMMTWGTGDDRVAEYRSSSPTSMCNIGQHDLEPILLNAALGFGADIRFEHEVLAVNQDQECASVRVRNRRDASERELRARYVVGCDGARSTVASEGGFELEGLSGLGDLVTVWIEADLSRYVAHRSGALFFVRNPGSDDLLSAWTCVKPWREWSTIFARFDLSPSQLTEEAVLPRVRAAIGDPDIPVRIKKVSEWQINHVVAADYRNGRLFLAGDAAHRHPPANGLGSNTSVQDSYNLAWKLALVCSGKADDSLLDSYSRERQPVGCRVVERANRSVAEMAPWVEAMGVFPGQSAAEADAVADFLTGPHGGKQREKLRSALEVLNGQFNAHGVEMSMRYESGAVVDDGTPWPDSKRDADLYYEATSHPGSPLPHAWVERDRTEVSTLDLCAYDRFTLIVGADGAAWTQAAETVAGRLDVPLDAVPLSLGLAANDVCGDWARLREIDDDGCLLVRPDRVVAWRMRGGSERPAEDLESVLRGILGLAPG